MYTHIHEPQVNILHLLLRLQTQWHQQNTSQSQGFFYQKHQRVNKNYTRVFLTSFTFVKSKTTLKKKNRSPKPRSKSYFLITHLSVESIKLTIGYLLTSSNSATINYISTQKHH